jgi:hypothetical protein
MKGGHEPLHDHESLVWPRRPVVRAHGAPPMRRINRKRAHVRV